VRVLHTIVDQLDKGHKESVEVYIHNVEMVEKDKEEELYRLPHEDHHERKHYLHQVVSLSNFVMLQ